MALRMEENHGAESFGGNFKGRKYFEKEIRRDERPTIVDYLGILNRMHQKVDQCVW